jgi:putative transcriptional regulator
MGDPRFRQRAIAMAFTTRRRAGAGGEPAHREIRLHALLEQLEIPAGDGADAWCWRAGRWSRGGASCCIHRLGGAGLDLRARSLGADGHVDVLRAIAEGRGPKRWLVALGYAGWGEGSWRTRCARTAGTPPTARWTCCGTCVGERWRGLDGEGIDVTRVAGGRAGLSAAGLELSRAPG